MSFQPQPEKEGHKNPLEKTLDSMFSKANHMIDNAQQPSKHLTIQIHKAELMINVSPSEKMTTYTKIQLGSFVWKTSVDNQGHMNPKWDEVRSIFSLIQFLVNKHRYKGIG